MDPERAHETTPAQEAPPSTGLGATVRDRRPLPQGGLPRQMQTWIMVGLALLILGIILITGRPEPGPVVPVATAPRAGGSLPPARVRSYQERLAEQEARLLQEAAVVPPAMSGPEEARVVAPPVPADPLEDEQRRRDAQSLFADNVAFSRRGGAVPTGSAMAQAVAIPPGPSAEQVTAAVGPAASQSVPPESRPSRVEVAASAGTQGRAAGAPVEAVETLLEGTVIETVLVNRLDGTFQGPVQCLVTTPVYSADRQTVVIPAGARVLGSAAPVQAWGDARLAVRFHRLVFQDGRTHSLDSFMGLSQVGETGLKDQVDRHYLQVFGASVAIGAIAGLAQVGTRSGLDQSFGDAARQSAGGSLAASTARVLDRYLNVLPTVTIREGHRIKVVLTSDLRLPAYAPVSLSEGGWR